MELVRISERIRKVNINEYIVPVMVSMVYVLAFQILNSENVKMIASMLFVTYLLVSGTQSSIYALMFIVCGNEMLNIGTTSIAMIFAALFAVKFVFCGLIERNIKISAILLILTTILVLMNFVQFVCGSSEQLMTTIKCIFFFIYAFDILKKNDNFGSTLYKSSFRIIALGINYFGIISIIINGLPMTTKRFSFSEEITINSLAIMCALAVVNLIYVIVIAGSNHKIFDTILIIGCMIWGILTQSRSFILAVSIGAILILLLSSSVKNKLKIIIAILTVIVVFAILIVTIPALKNIFLSALDRIVNPSGDDISNGRYILWKQYFDGMLSNNVYTWFGAGDFKNIGASFDNKVQVAHNLFIESWVIYGFVGCAFVFLMFFVFIKNNIFNYTCRRCSIVSFVPVIIMGIALFYSHHFIGGITSLVFIFSFLPIKNYNDETKQQESK